MKNYNLVLFKSPTCGPCKMFQPQLEKAIEMFNSESVESKVNLELVDVTTDEGLARARSNGISSSGEAILFDSDTILVTWNRPHSFSDILRDIKIYCK